MSKKHERDMMKYAAWIHRTGREFRKDDTGGKWLPVSAIEHGKHKPYGELIRIKEGRK